MKKNFFKSYEFYLIVLLTAVVLIIGLINPAFLSVGTLFDVIRIQTVNMLLALGLLPVVLLGGVDVSFVAIAAVTTFPIHMWLLKIGYTGGVWAYLALGLPLGLAIGLTIGFVLHRFKIGIFDLSLGMNSMIYGFILFFVSSFQSADMSTGLVGWNSIALITVDSVVGSSFLHVSFLFVVLFAVLIHLFLTYTVLGRSIYAVGSNKSVALRSGINPLTVYLAVFGILGLMSAVGGFVHSAIQSYFNPVLLLGKNLGVLAAVIMGGASIRGGKGTVLGTLLGVIIVGLISQALVYLAIPTVWMDAFVGTFLILFAVYQTIENRERKVI